MECIALWGPKYFLLCPKKDDFFHLFKSLPDSDSSEEIIFYSSCFFSNPPTPLKRQENLCSTKPLQKDCVLDGLLPHLGQAKSNKKCFYYEVKVEVVVSYYSQKVDMIHSLCRVTSRSHPSNLNITSKSYIVKVRKEKMLPFPLHCYWQLIQLTMHLPNMKISTVEL